MPNDITLTFSSIKGSIRWLEDDAYEIVMRKPEHYSHVRGVPGKLPRKSSSRLTRLSSQDLQVLDLLGETDTLKGLLMAQQERFQAFVAQYESQHSSRHM
jgi:hypothetical protein